MLFLDACFPHKLVKYKSFHIYCKVNNDWLRIFKDRCAKDGFVVVKIIYSDF